jgi:hypothetical protein
MMHPMVRILSLAAFLVSAQPAAPHPEEAAILAVVDSLMHAIGSNEAVCLGEFSIEGGSTIV